MQLATAHDFKDTFFTGFFDAQRHVVLQFLLQAVPNLTAGDVLTFAASQRASVNAEVHGQGRLINLEHWQRRRINWVGNRDTDAHIGNTVDQHDFARASFGGLNALQSLKRQHLVNAALDGFAVWAFHDNHIHHGTDGALADAANTDAADEG